MKDQHEFHHYHHTGIMNCRLGPYRMGEIDLEKCSCKKKKGSHGDLIFSLEPSLLFPLGLCFSLHFSFSLPHVSSSENLALITMT